MSKRRTSGGTQKNGGVMKGVLTAICCSAVLLLILSVLISRGAVKPDNAPAALALTELAAAFAGGLASGERGENRIKAALLTAVIFAALLIVLAAATDIDRLEPVSILRITGLSIAGAAAGGMPRLGKSNKKYHKKHTLIFFNLEKEKPISATKKSEKAVFYL